MLDPTVQSLANQGFKVVICLILDSQSAEQKYNDIRQNSGSRLHNLFVISIGSGKGTKMLGLVRDERQRQIAVIIHTLRNAYHDPSGHSLPSPPNTAALFLFAEPAEDASQCKQCHHLWTKEEEAAWWRESGDSLEQATPGSRGTWDESGMTWEVWV